MSTGNPALLFFVIRLPFFIESYPHSRSHKISDRLPPVHVIVPRINEKSQRQALDCSQPMLPFRPGQIAKLTHDYKRHGTTVLLAALDIATGPVIAKCYAEQGYSEIMAGIYADPHW